MRSRARPWAKDLSSGSTALKYKIGKKYIIIILGQHPLRIIVVYIKIMIISCHKAYYII